MNQSLIDACVLIPELDATAKDAALAEIVDRMVDAGAMAKKERATVIEQLQAREAQGSTGLGNGVAVPHVKETAVTEIRMAVAISLAGIPFEAIDGRAVHILFLVLGPNGAPPEDHLQVLRWVSTLARNADFRRFAQAAGTDVALRDLLTEMSG